MIRSFGFVFVGVIFAGLIGCGYANNVVQKRSRTEITCEKKIVDGRTGRETCLETRQTVITDEPYNQPGYFYLDVWGDSGSGYFNYNQGGPYGYGYYDRICGRNHVGQPLRCSGPPAPSYNWWWR